MIKIKFSTEFLYAVCCTCRFLLFSIKNPYEQRMLSKQRKLEFVQVNQLSVIRYLLETWLAPFKRRATSCGSPCFWRSNGNILTFNLLRNYYLYIFKTDFYMSLYSKSCVTNRPPWGIWGNNLIASTVGSIDTINVIYPTACLEKKVLNTKIYIFSMKPIRSLD